MKKNKKIKFNIFERKISPRVKTIRVFLRTSKNALISVLILFFALGGFFSWAISPKTEILKIFPQNLEIGSSFGNASWSNAENALRGELGPDSEIKEFNRNNSAYLDLSSKYISQEVPFDYAGESSESLNVNMDEDYQSSSQTFSVLTLEENSSEFVDIPSDELKTNASSIFEDFSGIILPDVDGKLPDDPKNEFGRDAEHPVIFTDRAIAQYSDFGLPEEGGDIRKVKIGFSFASEGFEGENDDEILVEWSLDGNDWNNAFTFKRDRAYSNMENGGYFHASIFDPKDTRNDELNWSDLKNFKVRFTALSNGGESLPAYLDAVWLDLEYVRSQEKEGEDNTNTVGEIKPITVKKDFKREEEPELKFHYQKKQGLFESIANVLGAGSGGKKINATARITNPEGESEDVSPEEIFESNGDVSIKLKKERGFKPGLYKITLVLREIDANGSVDVKETVAEQDFTWGILTINVNKSIYLPDESAYIQMGVLKNDGHTVCDASLKLQITDPKLQTIMLSTEDKTIEYSGKCDGDNVTDLPDYFAHYQVGEAGIYQMTLTRIDPVTGEKISEITDSFEVRESVPFEVERIGPTRIWPMAPYGMVLKIKANQDFSGDIVETVPEGFVVMNQELRIKNQESEEFIMHDSKFIIQERGDKAQSLIFQNVVLKQNDELEIRYKFDAPDISPYIYLLGPLSIGDFTEARQWQIASDATLTLRPSVAGTYQAWSTFGSPASHWEGTSDVSDTTGVQSPNGDTTSKETENLADTSQTGTINSVTAYMKAKAVSSNSTPLTDGFEASGTAWDDLWDANGATSWTQGQSGEGEAGHSPRTGSNDAWAGNGTEGYFTSDNIDLSGATSASLDFWYYLDDNETTDFELYLFDGTTYDLIEQIGGGTESTWLQYTISSLDAQYFISNFRIRFNAVLGSGESSFVDDLVVTKSTSGNEQAKIIWKLGATEVQAGAQTISTSAFTEYSDVRATDPDGGAWSWTDVNNLEIGAIASTLGASEYIQDSEFWIVVDYTPSITVSGGCFTDAGEGTPCSDAGAEEVAVSVNGAAPVTVDTTVDGSWSGSVNQPSSGDILTFFINGEATELEEATTVIKYDGDGGNVTNVKMYQSMMVIGADAGSANSDQTITNADLDPAANGYDNTDDEDITYSYTAGTSTLAVDDDNNKSETLYIISGDIYRPDSVGGETLNTLNLYVEGTLTSDSNSFNTAGDFTNTGTFTANSSTFTFNGSAAQTITTGGTGAGKDFNNVTFSNTYGTPPNITYATNAMTIGGNVTLTQNTSISSTNLALVITGTINGANILSIDSGSGAVTFGGIIGGSTPITSLASSGSGAVAINTTGITTRDAASNNVSFTGAVTLGANLVITTDTAGTDGNITFTSTVNSTDVTDRALTLASGTADISIAGAIGATNDLSSLTITGNDITLANIGAGSAGVTGATSVTGDATGTIILTGTVYNTAGTQAYNAGGAARTITLNDAAAFTTSDDAVTFTGLVDSQTTENNAVALNAGTAQVTFNNNIGATQSIGLLTKQGSGDLKFGSSTLASTGLTLSAGTINTLGTDSGAWIVSGDVTISNGTLKSTTNTLTVGGNWTNSDTFTHNSGTVIFNKSSSTQTLNSGGTGAGKSFNNLTHSGAGTLQLSTNAIQADGNFTNSAGTFDANGLNVVVAGNFNTSGGTFSAGATPGTQTVTFIGNVSAHQTFTTNTQTFNNITLNNTQGTYDQIIISNNLDIDGDLTITDGILKLNTNNPNVTVAGAVSIESAGSVAKGTGTWTFDGTTAKTYADSSSSGPQNIGAVLITKTNGTASNNKITLGSGMTVDTMTISASNTLDLASSGHVLTLANAGATATAFTVTGTLTPGTNSTVKYTATNSGGNVNVTTTTYNSIEFAPSSAETYSLTGNLTGANAITGNVTIGANATFNADAGGTPAITASDTLPAKYSSDPYAETAAVSYTKIKELTMTSDYTGSWRIKFDLAGDPYDDCAGDCTGFARIYKNGVAYGTERSNNSIGFITYSEDFAGINISSGDLIQLYAYASPGTYVAAQNFRIQFDETASGSSDIAVAGNWSNSGAFTAGTGTVTFNGAVAQAITGANTWNNLTIINTYSSPDDTYDVDPGAAQTVGGTLTITDGQWTPCTGDDYANISIGASGIMKPDASASITVSGDWTKAGTFTHNSGTVTFDGADSSIQTFTGDSIFNDFIASTSGNAAGRTLKFTDGSTTTVSGTWTITGFSGKVITLARTSTSSAWSINPTSASVTYANVSWSNSGLAICATYSTDGGNNDADWSFSAGASCGITVSGIAYTDEGSSTLNSSGGTIKLVNNTTGTTSSDANGTDGAGVWEITGVAAPSVGDMLTIWINGAAADGTLAVEYGASCTGYTNCTGLKIYQDRVILRSENNNSLANSDLSGCDNDSTGTGTECTDTEIGFTSNSNALEISEGRKLIIWTGDTLIAGGTVTTSISNDGTDNVVDGDLLIQSGAILSMGANALSVGGDYANSGDFSKSSTQTATFTATASGFQITPGLDNFDNLTFDGVSGGWSFTEATVNVDNNFTITNGAVTAPSTNLNIAGNYSNSGTFTHNSSTVTFTAADSGNIISDGGSAFYNIIFNGSGDWIYTDGSSTAPNQTTVQNGTPTYLNAKTGTVSVTGGTLNIDWHLGTHLVDVSDTATDIDTNGDADITISENSGSPAATVFRHNGSVWSSGATSQTTGTSVSGKNPQPNSDGAIRIREYSKTASSTTYYLYNLHVDWQNNYGEYDYYNDYGGKYLTSSANSGSGQDETISVSWYRGSAGTMNGIKEYDGVNNSPTQGSWYAGMLGGLTFSIDSFSVDLGTLDPGAAPATGTNTLTVTTSATNGYVITAWTTAAMTCTDAGECGSDSIADWTGDNTVPTTWSAGSYGFGYSTDDITLLTGTTDRFSGPKYAAFVHSGPGDLVADRSAIQCPCSGQQNTITYRIAASAVQRPGPYSATVIYVATPQY